MAISTLALQDGFFVSLSSHPSEVSTCVPVPGRPHLSPRACISAFPTCDYDRPSLALIVPPCSKTINVCHSGLKLGPRWSISPPENVMAYSV